MITQNRQFQLKTSHIFITNSCFVWFFFLRLLLLSLRCDLHTCASTTWISISIHNFNLFRWKKKKKIAIVDRSTLPSSFCHSLASSRESRKRRERKSRSFILDDDDDAKKETFAIFFFLSSLSAIFHLF